MSVLLSLASCMSMFSFLLVLVKIELARSCVGISLKMFECYCVVQLFRLFSIIPFEG